MKLLDLLARLGILRWGAKAAIYRSGAERPAEFVFTDVYDARRDLGMPENQPPPKGGQDVPGPSECSHKPD